MHANDFHEQLLVLRCQAGDEDCVRRVGRSLPFTAAILSSTHSSASGPCRRRTPGGLAGRLSCSAAFGRSGRVGGLALLHCPALEACGRDIVALEEQLDKPAPEGPERDLLDMTARMTVAQGAALFTITAITLWGIVLVLAVLAAAGICTALLVLVTRRATLRQIQVSLLALSAQFEALGQSLDNARRTGSDQAT